MREEMVELGVLGGGAALAGAGAAADAQEATPPSADIFDGRYAVIRIRRMKPEYSAEELARTVREGFLPIIRDVPAFEASFAIVNEAARTWISIGIFTGKTGSDDPTARAIEFGQPGTHDWVEPDPVIVDGVIGATALSL